MTLKWFLFSACDKLVCAEKKKVKERKKENTHT